MAILKFRSGGNVVELVNTATTANIQNRLSTVEANVNSRNYYWDGIWRVEKRSDGVARVSGGLNRSISSSGIYSGGIYFYNFSPPAFPSGLFKAAPYCQVTMHSANATAWVASYSDSTTSVSSPQSVRIMSATNGTINVTLMYEAIGGWR